MLVVECFFMAVSIVSAIPIVCRARAFARNHWRAERAFRRAFHAEGRAFVRFDLPLQHQAAQAFSGFLDARFSDAEFFLGVERGVFPAQAQTALRNLPDAAPFA